MMTWKRSTRRTLVAVAVAATGATEATRAAGPGIWYAPSSPSTCSECRDSQNCYECRDSEKKCLFGSCDFDAERLIDRVRKAPFDHYAHNPGDLQDRPYCPPYCSPTAGYYEPQWRQLPSMLDAVPAEPMYGPPSYPAYPEHIVPAPTPAPPQLSPPPAPPSSVPPEAENQAAPSARVAPPTAGFLDPYPPMSAGPTLTPLSGTSQPMRN
ncbi:MAG: hypothetical protein WBC44_14965 [Planctomycetaceae bacterium]